MFRIEFFTDDKQLAKALTALSGLAYNLKVEPVINAIVAEKKVKQAGEKKPTYLRVYERLIHRGKSIGDRIVSIDIRDAMADEKIADSTYSAIITKLKNDKLLVPLTRGQFTIQEQK